MIKFLKALGVFIELYRYGFYIHRQYYSGMENFPASMRCGFYRLVWKGEPIEDASDIGFYHSNAGGRQFSTLLKGGVKRLK